MVLSSKRVRACVVVIVAPRSSSGRPPAPAPARAPLVFSAATCRKGLIFHVLTRWPMMCLKALNHLITAGSVGACLLSLFTLQANKIGYLSLVCLVCGVTNSCSSVCYMNFFPGVIGCK